MVAVNAFIASKSSSQRCLSFVPPEETSRPSLQSDITTACAVTFAPRLAPASGAATLITSSSRSTASTKLSMLNPTAASVLAGSVAGAVGVGVAFPLDTLKTKAQVMGQEQAAPLSPTITSSAAATTAQQQDMNMIAMFVLIWKAEGLAGFFSGVKGMMAGQAVIKAIAFTANNFALNFIQEQHVLPASSGLVALVLAASFSGFVTSFVVAPVERVKVMMQASGKSLYQNDLQCAKAVIRTEGLTGLFGRGLGVTIAREVPSYGLYFVTYSLLSQTAAADMLGSNLSPLVFGALAGMACWLPVYPVDVVKTLMQNTEGENGDEDSGLGTWDVVQDLYAEGGIGAFFDGLTPKMLRAAVNHSVTFWCYSLLMGFLQ